MLAKHLLKLTYLFATLPVTVLSFAASAQAWPGPYAGSNPWNGNYYGRYVAPTPPPSYGYPQTGSQQPYYPPMEKKQFF